MGVTTHKKKPNRWNHFNRFVDFAMRELTSAEIQVWLVLFRDCREGVAVTGQTDIARRTGLSIRSIKYAIAALKSKGYIVVTKQGRLASGPSSYKVRGYLSK
jgi:DNA-binding MarR family transcriptional regulator